jgi:sulfate adenylyltransferase subunit 2
MKRTLYFDSVNLMGLDLEVVWDFNNAIAHLKSVGNADNEQSAKRILHDFGIIPPELTSNNLKDELGRSVNSVVLNWAIENAYRHDKIALFAQLATFPNGGNFVHFNDPRNHRYWFPFKASEQEKIEDKLSNGFKQLQAHLGKEITIYPHGKLVGIMRTVKMPDQVTLNTSAYLPALDMPDNKIARCSATPHLKRLEAESIHIFREAVAEAENPVMMYSVGKDSSVMLHLARKAFYPAPPPFPLLHVDTRWKFQEMYIFRDFISRVSGMQLIVHINPEAIAKDINPFDHGSALHTEITKTEGLKQALDKYKFDFVFGGARRDEEKSRAKERIFSFRSSTHRWEPKQQRPELWNLFNTKKGLGESIRVFPLSNWTEIDIWQYIYQENITVVPLYFARKRPVVVRDGMILLVDDGRFRLLQEEEIIEKVVRFRTLGCYPLTSAIESSATNLQEIILETINARTSERQGRAIDSDASASMEKKKQEGYF